MIGRWIGAAPRQRGSSEPCRLRQPSRGASRIGLRQDEPVGDDDGDIGAERGEFGRASALRRLLGVRTGMPNRSATRWTGEGRSSMPRPAGRGARV